MQITLIQSEIEQALTDYIHSQINVKEGQKITIELKATRGAEGTTAVIDIVADKPTAKADPVVKPQVVTNKPSTQAKPEVKAEPKVEVKPDPKPEVVSEDPADAAADANADAQANDTQAGAADNAGVSGEAGASDAGEAGAGEAQAADPVVETPAADGAAKPKSLFEGLRKPKND